MEEDAFAFNTSTSRVLAVDYKNWNHQISITDFATDQLLYVLVGNGRRNGLTTTNTNGEVVGSSNTHSMSSRIDVETTSTIGVNNTFEMRTGKILGGSHSFTSPAFDGQRMTWKNKLMSTKIIYTLIDERGLALANFESAPKSKRKIGKLEILDTVVEQDKVNEIAVTVLTLLYRKLMALRDSAAVAVM